MTLNEAQVEEALRELAGEGYTFLLAGDVVVALGSSPKAFDLSGTPREVKVEEFNDVDELLEYLFNSGYLSLPEEEE